MKRMFVLFFLPTLLLLGSCATILSGSKQHITVDSEPPEAAVIVEGDTVGSTPVTFKVKRRFATFAFTVKKEGYKIEEIQLDHEGNPKVVWNVFNLWLLSWIDAITGAMVKYQDYTKLELERIVISDYKIEKLNKLKALFDEGILTEEEFKRKKSAVLKSE